MSRRRRATYSDALNAELTVREAHAGDADLLRSLLCRAFVEYEGLNVRIALGGLGACDEADGDAPIASHAHAGYASPTYVEMEKDVSGAPGH